MKRKGRQSIEFRNAPYIIGEASVAGKLESEGPMGSYFHEVCLDPMVGANTWEEAESKLVEKATQLALVNAKVDRRELSVVIGGDLLAQLMATSFGLATLNVPFFGVYGACSTMGESLLLSAMMVDGEFAEYALAVTSSHFAGAEKQFRFPLAYGCQRPASATWTVTGSGAAVVASEESLKRHPGAAGNRVRITAATIGKIVDYGIQDSMNMGACMAPAAASVIAANLEDLERDADYYDLIVTGDLGTVGSRILCEMLESQGHSIKKKHFDCGVELFNPKKQDVHAGGSGCGCSAIVLTGYLLRKLREGAYRRILFVPTGALISPVSFHEDCDIPGIAYGIVLEASDY